MNDSNNQNTVKYQYIGDISVRLRVSTRTIRYYEELGLIVPKRSDSGYREYSDLEVEKFTTILRLKKLGLSLDEIRNLIKLKQHTVDKNSAAKLLAQLHKRLHEFEDKISEYKEGVREIGEMIGITESCTECKKEAEVFTCTKCLEENNKQMPSLMKAMF